MINITNFTVPVKSVAINLSSLISVEECQEMCISNNLLGIEYTFGLTIAGFLMCVISNVMTDYIDKCPEEYKEVVQKFLKSLLRLGLIVQGLSIAWWLIS